MNDEDRDTETRSDRIEYMTTRDIETKKFVSHDESTNGDEGTEEVWISGSKPER